LQKRFPTGVQNLHMGYEAESRIDESFGIECARLARFPEEILSVATERSAAMQEEVQGRARRNRFRKAPYLIEESLKGTGIVAEAALETLQSTLESL